MQSSPTLLMPTLGMLAKNHPLPNFHLPLAQPLTHVRFVALTDLFPPSSTSSPSSFLLTHTTSSSYQRMHEYTGFEYRQLPRFFSPPLNKQAAIEALKHVHMLHTYQKRPSDSEANRDMHYKESGKGD